MTAVELREGYTYFEAYIHMIGCAFIYRVHVVLEYPTDVKNIKIQ